MSVSSRCSANDSGGDSDSGTPEPATEHPQALGDEGGGSGGSSSGVDLPRVFEVEFPPTGPLGITFEWAVDPRALWYGDGGTPATSPRTPPLGSSTLPPISPSPSSATKSRAAHPLEPPVGPAVLPHALRIQSFPDLPPLVTPRSSTPEAGTTTTAGGDNKITADGEIQPTTVTSSDIQAFPTKNPAPLTSLVL